MFARSKGFLQGAVGSLTGKELPRLVDELTREMVVVAEGLSEDGEKLRAALALQGEEQDRVAERIRALEKQAAEAVRRLDDLSRKLERRDKKETGMYRILRQATWLAAILGAAWVMTTLIGLLGK